MGPQTWFTPRRFVRTAQRNQTKQLALMNRQRPPAPATGPPAPQQGSPLAVPAAPKGIAGRAYDIQQRAEQGMLDVTPQVVLTFRLARWSRDQKPQPHVDVEMRGPSLRGSIRHGDWLQLPENYNPNRPLTRLTNLTTGQQVEMRGMRGQTVYRRIFLTCFITFAVVILFVILTHL